MQQSIHQDDERLDKQCRNDLNERTSTERVSEYVIEAIEHARARTSDDEPSPSRVDSSNVYSLSFASPSNSAARLGFIAAIAMLAEGGCVVQTPFAATMEGVDNVGRSGGELCGGCGFPFACAGTAFAATRDIAGAACDEFIVMVFVIAAMNGSIGLPEAGKPKKSTSK